MDERETLRDAVVYRIKNPPHGGDDNMGLGFTIVVLFGVIPVAVVVAICCTIYYCLKLYAS